MGLHNQFPCVCLAKAPLFIDSQDNPYLVISLSNAYMEAKREKPLIAPVNNFGRGDPSSGGKSSNKEPVPTSGLIKPYNVNML